MQLSGHSGFAGAQQKSAHQPYSRIGEILTLFHLLQQAIGPSGPEQHLRGQTAAEENCKQPNGHEDNMALTEEGHCSSCLRYLNTFSFCASKQLSEISKCFHINSEVEEDVRYTKTFVPSGLLMEPVVSFM